MVSRVINRYTTILVPDDKAWKRAYKQDQDTAYLIATITDRRRLNYAWLQEKGYFQAW